MLNVVRRRSVRVREAVSAKRLRELLSGRRRRAVTVAVGLVALAVVAWLWKRGPNLTVDTRDDLGAGGQLQAISQFRTMLLQATAAIGGVIALAYTARNYRLSRRGQTTDRFTKALEKLGSADMYVRIGGVYALEQVARDSPELHVNIVDVLVAFIRAHAARSGPIRIDPGNATSHHGVRAVVLPTVTEPIDHPRTPRDDIQAALTVLGHLHRRRRLNLANIHLTGAQLDEANLTGADLFRTNLAGAILIDTNLDDADLGDTNLTGAWLGGASLTNAWLGRANLTGAHLSDTNLTDAKLLRANLTGAYLGGANLTDADLREANLTYAHLSDTNLTDADLDDADLTQTELWRARITADQVNSTSTSRDAELPAHLIRDMQQLGRVRDATPEETAAAEQAHRDQHGD